MFVRDIMTKDTLTAKPDDTLEKVLDLFAKKKVSGCPVVSGKRIVGIITQTDILKMIDVHSKIQSAESGLFPLILATIKSEQYDRLRDALKHIMCLKVKEFMSKTVITVEADDDIYRAARLMNKNDVNRLPVTDKNKLVGIIAREDIIQALEELEK